MASEPEDDSWDQDCVIGHVDLDLEYHLCGYQPKCSEELMAPPRKMRKLCPQKKKLCPLLRESLNQTDFIETFRNVWKNNETMNTNDVEAINNPYQVSVIQNFLRSDEFVKDMILEFDEINWNKKSVDLYEFYQSADLNHLEGDFKSIGLFHKFLKWEVKPWLENVTGLELTRIAATCSFYGDTDYLLVHDDLQDHRAIAFVYYLNGYGDWKPTHGGSLQLINIKDGTSVRDILPRNNQFVFFTVSRKSFHQVQEVMNKSTCRLSINGWFHNKNKAVSKKHIFYETENLPKIKPESTNPQAQTLEIADSYVDSTQIKEIQSQIEENSEISLPDYFNKAKFDEYVSSVKSDTIEWVMVGPLSRRRYEIASEENLPQATQALIDGFKSQHMFDLLKKYTDLELTSMRYELQRWTSGCYSLLTDFTSDDKKELEVILFLGCDKGDGKSVIGGQIMYVASEEVVQEALITIEPKDNQLNIVYRDTGRFTKYVSKYSKSLPYYVLICSYTEDE